MKIEEYELAEAIHVFNAHRSKIVAEDNLINFRLNWMLWSNAIFFGMWASIMSILVNNIQFIMLTNHYRLTVRILEGGMICINATGIFVSFLSWLTIRSALREIDRIKEIYYYACPGLVADQKIPDLHAGDEQINAGFLIARWMPIVFILLQAVLLGLTAFGWWYGLGFIEKGATI